jgi:TRAP-type transport system periplasmic protein
MKKSVLAAALLAATALSPLPISAQTNPIELRYASGSPPQGTPWARQGLQMASDVDKGTKGTYKVQVFFNSQLGSEADVIQQIARGRVDLGGFTIGSAALIVPEISLLAMPFYFDGPAQLDCIIDNHLNPVVTEMFGKKGLQLLGWGEIGEVNLYGKKAYVKPSDLQGVKAAVIPSKSQVLFYQQLGANAVPLPIPEWISSMQTGLTETVLTVISFSLPSGLTKVIPTITKMNSYNAPALTFMNKASFDKLSPEYKAVFMYPKGRSDEHRAEVRSFENVLHNLHEKSGGTIVRINDEQRKEWRKALEPYYPKVVAELGEGGKAFFDKMETARKACTK